MRKISLYFIVFIFVCFYIFPISVFAHPGNTDGNGCHYCRTNCAKWGLANGQYHCHNGGSSGSNSSSSSSSSNNYVVKSSDNTIKNVVIGGYELSFDSDNKSSVKISGTKLEMSVNLNDSKATYEISGNNELKIGDNEVTIIVTAENGNKKTYIVNVYRKNNDNTIKSLSIDDEKVEVQDTMSFITSKTYVKADVVLNDNKADFEIVGTDRLVNGENEFKIIVTAEDESQKEYKVIITRVSDKNVSSSASIEEGNDTSERNPLATILGLGVTGGVGFGIYSLVKKK